MSQSVQAAVTKYRTLGGLDNRNLFLIVPEAGSPRLGYPQIHFLVKALFLACLLHAANVYRPWLKLLWGGGADVYGLPLEFLGESRGRAGGVN